jgi:hypothetical protein
MPGRRISNIVARLSGWRFWRKIFAPGSRWGSWPASC